MADLGTRIISFVTDFKNSFTDMEKFKNVLSSVGKGAEEAFKHINQMQLGLIGMNTPLGNTVVKMSELSLATGILSVALGKIPIVGPPIEKTLKGITLAMLGMTAAITAGVGVVGQLVESVGERLTAATKKYLEIGMQFEQQQFGLTASLQAFEKQTGLATISTEKLIKEIRDISAVTGIAATDIKQGVNIMFEMSAVTGLTAEQINILIKSMADFATVRGVAFNDVVLAIDQSFRGFNRRASALGLTLDDASVSMLAAQKGLHGIDESGRQSSDTTLKFQIALSQLNNFLGKSAEAATDFAFGGLRKLQGELNLIHGLIGQGVANAWQPLYKILGNLVQVIRSTFGDSIFIAIGYISAFTGAVLTAVGATLKWGTALVILVSVINLAKIGWSALAFSVNGILLGFLGIAGWTTRLIAQIPILTAIMTALETRIIAVAAAMEGMTIGGALRSLGAAGITGIISALGGFLTTLAGFLRVPLIIGGVATTIFVLGKAAIDSEKEIGGFGLAFDSLMQDLSRGIPIIGTVADKLRNLVPKAEKGERPFATIPSPLDFVPSPATGYQFLATLFAKEGALSRLDKANKTGNINDQFKASQDLAENESAFEKLKKAIPGPTRRLLGIETKEEQNKKYSALLAPQQGDPQREALLSRIGRAMQVTQPKQDYEQQLLGLMQASGLGTSFNEELEVNALIRNFETNFREVKGNNPAFYYGQLLAQMGSLIRNRKFEQAQPLQQSQLAAGAAVAGTDIFGARTSGDFAKAARIERDQKEKQLDAEKERRENEIQKNAVDREERLKALNEEFEARKKQLGLETEKSLLEAIKERFNIMKSGYQDTINAQQNAYQEYLKTAGKEYEAAKDNLEFRRKAIEQEKQERLAAITTMEITEDEKRTLRRLADQKEFAEKITLINQEIQARRAAISAGGGAVEGLIGDVTRVIRAPRNPLIPLSSVQQQALTLQDYNAEKRAFDMRREDPIIAVAKGLEVGRQVAQAQEAAKAAGASGGGYQALGRAALDNLSKAFNASGLSQGYNLAFEAAKAEKLARDNQIKLQEETKKLQIESNSYLKRIADILDPKGKKEGEKKPGEVGGVPSTDKIPGEEPRSYKNEKGEWTISNIPPGGNTGYDVSPQKPPSPNEPWSYKDEKGVFSIRNYPSQIGSGLQPSSKPQGDDTTPSMYGGGIASGAASYLNGFRHLREELGPIMDDVVDLLDSVNERIKRGVDKTIETSLSDTIRTQLARGPLD